MNCSFPGCNASHRAFVHTPGNSDPQPFCGPHALEALTQVAPVIDINTRKRVAMNWNTRYATENCEKCNTLQSSMRSAFDGLKSDGLSDKQYKSLKLQGQTSSIDLGQHMAQDHPLEL